MMPNLAVYLFELLFKLDCFKLSWRDSCDKFKKCEKMFKRLIPLVTHTWHFKPDLFTQVAFTQGPLYVRVCLCVSVATHIWSRSQCQWGPAGSWTSRPAAWQPCCNGKLYLQSAWTSHPELLTGPYTQTHNIRGDWPATIKATPY